MRVRRTSILKKATCEYKEHVPGQLLFSSANHNWNNLLVSDFLMPDMLSGGLAPAIPDYSLGLIYSGGNFAGEWSVQSDSWKAHDVHTDQICLLPPQNTIDWHWWPSRKNGMLKLVITHLSSDLVSKMAGETFNVNPDRVEIKTSLIASDPLLQQLILATKNEVARGNPCGPLYGETAAEMMAVHLLARHSALKPQIMYRKQGLPPTRLRKVLEYIDTNLDLNLSLHELAKLAGMSNYHFLRLFKQSTGETPLQFIIRARMERAKALLAVPRASVIDVAHDVGYENVSHFIALFKRHTGITPLVYQKKP